MTTPEACWQPKPWPDELCPFCGGSGRIVTVSDPQHPYVRSGDRLVPRAIPGTERDCNICGGTGRNAPRP